MLNVGDVPASSSSSLCAGAPMSGLQGQHSMLAASSSSSAMHSHSIRSRADALQLEQPDITVTPFPSQQQQQIASTLIQETLKVLPVQPELVTNMQGPVLEMRKVSDSDVDIRITHGFRAHFGRQQQEQLAAAEAAAAPPIATLLHQLQDSIGHDQQHGGRAGSTAGGGAGGRRQSTMISTVITEEEDEEGEDGGMQAVQRTPRSGEVQQPRGPANMWASAVAPAQPSLVQDEVTAASPFAALCAQPWSSASSLPPPQQQHATADVAMSDQPPGLGTHPLPPSLGSLALTTVSPTGQALVPHSPGPSILAGPTPSRCEWQLDANRITLGRRIAVGGFSEVFVGTYEGTLVAAKRLFGVDNDTISRFVHEVRTLARLRHPNLILWMGYTLTPEPSIITEFMSRGSLYAVIRSRRGLGLDPRLVQAAAVSVARGMAYLHTRSPPILHLDLKSPNILIDEKWRIKIADFGLSIVRQNTYVSSGNAGGTPEWMAPEVLRCERYDEAADVYSFGVVLWELLTSHAPWEDMNPMQVVGAVGFSHKSLPLPTEGEPELLRLCAACLSLEPAARPRFPAIVQLLDRQYGGSLRWMGSDAESGEGQQRVGMGEGGGQGQGKQPLALPAPGDDQQQQGGQEQGEQQQQPGSGRLHRAASGPQGSRDMDVDEGCGAAEGGQGEGGGGGLLGAAVLQQPTGAQEAGQAQGQGQGQVIPWVPQQTQQAQQAQQAQRQQCLAAAGSGGSGGSGSSRRRERSQCSRADSDEAMRPPVVARRDDGGKAPSPRLDLLLLAQHRHHAATAALEHAAGLPWVRSSSSLSGTPAEHGAVAAAAAAATGPLASALSRRHRRTVSSSNVNAAAAAAAAASAAAGALEGVDAEVEAGHAPGGLSRPPSDPGSPGSRSQGGGVLHRRCASCASSQPGAPELPPAGIIEELGAGEALMEAGGVVGEAGGQMEQQQQLQQGLPPVGGRLGGRSRSSSNEGGLPSLLQQVQQQQQQQQLLQQGVQGQQQQQQQQQQPEQGQQQQQQQQRHGFAPGGIAQAVGHGPLTAMHRAPSSGPAPLLLHGPAPWLGLQGGTGAGSAPSQAPLQNTAAVDDGPEDDLLEPCSLSHYLMSERSAAGGQQQGQLVQRMAVGTEVSRTGTAANRSSSAGFIGAAGSLDVDSCCLNEATLDAWLQPTERPGQHGSGVFSGSLLHQHGGPLQQHALRGSRGRHGPETLGSLDGDSEDGMLFGGASFVPPPSAATPPLRLLLASAAAAGPTEPQALAAGRQPQQRPFGGSSGGENAVAARPSLLHPTRLSKPMDVASAAAAGGCGSGVDLGSGTAGIGLLVAQDSDGEDGDPASFSTWTRQDGSLYERRGRPMLQLSTHGGAAAAADRQRQQQQQQQQQGLAAWMEECSGHVGSGHAVAAGGRLAGAALADSAMNVDGDEEEDRHGGGDGGDAELLSRIARPLNTTRPAVLAAWSAAAAPGNGLCAAAAASSGSSTPASFSHWGHPLSARHMQLPSHLPSPCAPGDASASAAGGATDWMDSSPCGGGDRSRGGAAAPSPFASVSAQLRPTAAAADASLSTLSFPEASAATGHHRHLPFTQWPPQRHSVPLNTTAAAASPPGRAPPLLPLAAAAPAACGALGDEAMEHSSAPALDLWSVPSEGSMRRATAPHLATHQAPPSLLSPDLSTIASALTPELQQMMQHATAANNYRSGRFRVTDFSLPRRPNSASNLATSVSAEVAGPGSALSPALSMEQQAVPVAAAARRSDGGAAVDTGAVAAQGSQQQQHSQAAADGGHNMTRSRSTTTMYRKGRFFVSSTTSQQQLEDLLHEPMEVQEEGVAAQGPTAGAGGQGPHGASAVASAVPVVRMHSSPGCLDAEIFSGGAAAGAGAVGAAQGAQEQPQQQLAGVPPLPPAAAHAAGLPPLPPGASPRLPHGHGSQQQLAGKQAARKQRAPQPPAGLQQEQERHYHTGRFDVHEMHALRPQQQQQPHHQHPQHLLDSYTSAPPALASAAAARPSVAGTLSCLADGIPAPLPTVATAALAPSAAAAAPQQQRRCLTIDVHGEAATAVAAGPSGPPSVASAAATPTGAAASSPGSVTETPRRVGRFLILTENASSPTLEQLGGGGCADAGAASAAVPSASSSPPPPSPGSGSEGAPVPPSPAPSPNPGTGMKRIQSIGRFRVWSEGQQS